MIEDAQQLQAVLEESLTNALYAAPETTILFNRYDDLNDDVAEDGTRGSFSLDNLEIEVNDLLTLYGSIADHKDAGIGVVTLSGAVNEAGYFFDPFSYIENEVFENVEFHATFLVDYAAGRILDLEITYDIARDKFTTDSTLTELGDGTVLYELGDEVELLFGYEAPNAGDTSLAPLDELDLGDGPDPLSLVGTAGDDKLVGQDGDDTLLGGDGDDVLRGNDGDDLIKGGKGDDDLRGGNGNDLLNGNKGDDVAFGLSGSDRLLGGGGNDALHGGHDDDRLYGHNGDDTLYGGRDADFLRGGAGDDTLSGDNGDDMLIGDTGSDMLMGGRNNDVLDGGTGDDVLTGGHGKDVYVICTDGSTDTITDFTSGEDKIALAGFSGKLSDLFLSQEDSALRITLEETTVILENMSEDGLSADDFLM